MRKYYLLSLLTMVCLTVSSQATLYSNSFESSIADWTFSGDLTPNTWIRNTCAGNGPSAAGTSALYITKGGSEPGCGASGTEQYAYDNSTTGTNVAIAFTTVDAICVTAVDVQFDYKIDGVVGQDYLELVYSTNGGTTWTAVGGAMTSSNGWNYQFTNLPNSLAGTIFKLGFRFTYNNATVSGVPAAIDNLTITGFDTQTPTITCPTPTTVYLNSSCQGSIPDYTTSVVWNDNCTTSSALMTFVQTPVGGTLTSDNQLVTIIITDPSGNSSSCSFNQPMLDSLSPSLVCPPNQSVAFVFGCNSALDNYIPLVTTTENCFFGNNVSYTQSPQAGTPFGATQVVTITAIDAAGNDGTCSFTITPSDQTAPTITCPSNAIVNTNVGCTHVLSAGTPAVIADNCTPAASLIFVQSPAPGTALPLGDHTITYTITDAVGLTASCAYQLTVTDLSAPVITCPSGQNVTINAECSGVIGDYIGLATASDNCTATAQLTLTQTPPQGTTISANTAVTISTTDVAGNIGTCTFTAVIFDTINPVITQCPTSVDVIIDNSCSFLVPNLATAIVGTDNCTATSNLTVTQNPPVGATEIGLTAALITLIDQQGNSTSCVTMLTPDDNIAPQITCPSPQPVNNGVNCNYTLPFYGSTALVLDNCQNYSITQTPAQGTLVQAGVSNIQLEVMDAGGNIAQCSFNVTINEIVLPTITCPNDIITCDPLVNYTAPSFNDNCVATLAQTDLSGLTSGNTFPIGFTNQQYTVTDASGNATSCSFQVQVLEFPAPAVILDDTISICGLTSVVVNAEAPSSGIGEWSLISGQAAFNNQFANSTGVNNLAYGTSFLEWTVTSPSCGVTSDTLVLIASQNPLPASTQDTIFTCADDSVVLLSNVPLYGTGLWSTNLEGNIANPLSASTSATSLSNGWNEFIWTITSGTCPSTSDTLRVFAVTNPVIAQGDTSVCIENGLLNLSATLPVDEQTPSWYFIQGGGMIDGQFTSNSSVDDWLLGNDILVYTLEHPVCATVSDTLIVSASLCEGFNPVFPTMITPNFDGLNDLFVINYLEKVYPECEVTIFNRWGSVVFKSIGYEKPWDGTRNGEELPIGTYFYNIDLNDTTGKEYHGSISIIY
jgi:gliding motility-associated-like protein